MALSPKVKLAIIVILATLLAITVSAMLLQSTSVALAFTIFSSGALITIVNPFFGLGTFLAVLYLRPQEFIEAMRGLPLILIIGSATAVVTFGRSAISRSSLARAPQNLFVLWFFVAIILGHLSNAYIGGAVGSGLSFLNVMIFYFLLLNLIDSKSRLNGTWNLIAVCTVFLAIMGIYQGVTGRSFAGVPIEGRIRGLGIFHDPNDLAMALIIPLPYLVLKLLGRTNGVLKVLYLAFVGVLFYAIYLTNSRGGFVSMGVMFSVLFVRRYGWRVGSVLAMLGLVAMVAAGPSRLKEISARDDSSYGRVEAWAEGLSMLKMRPVFGVGPGRFTEYHFRVAHNSFVHTAAEVGLFGLFAWTMLLLLSVKNILYVRRGAREEGDLDLSLLSEAVFLAWVGVLMSIMFLSRSYNPLLFMLMALSAVCTNLHVRGRENDFKLLEKKDFTLTAATVVVGLILCQIYLLTYW